MVDPRRDDNCLPRYLKAANIPARDILYAMTINGYKAADIINQRGPIKPGLFADLIAVNGDPLTDIDTLRNVQFVMKNGMVFKKDGVMTPGEVFPPGTGANTERQMDQIIIIRRLRRLHSASAPQRNVFSSHERNRTMLGLLTRL